MMLSLLFLIDTGLNTESIIALRVGTSRRGGTMSRRNTSKGTADVTWTRRATVGRWIVEEFILKGEFE
jgi:hypothetical protein